jgi:hypothetical protein
MAFLNIFSTAISTFEWKTNARTVWLEAREWDRARNLFPQSLHPLQIQMVWVAEGKDLLIGSGTMDQRW